MAPVNGSTVTVSSIILRPVESFGIANRQKKKKKKMKMKMEMKMKERNKTKSTSRTKDHELDDEIRTGEFAEETYRRLQ
jgi:hypothetical protein